MTKMTEHEDFYFDVSGYLIVRNVLSTPELGAINRAFGQVVGAGDAMPDYAGCMFPFVQLRDHPVLTGYLEQILGEGFRPDEGPEPIGGSTLPESDRLVGGDEWVDWSRGYRHQAGVRLCQAVRVLWALADIGPDDGGVVLIPASHNSHVQTPDDVLSGRDDMRLLVQPALQAGDLLICAHSLVFGERPWRGPSPSRTLAWTYISALMPTRDWRRPEPTENRSKPWSASLTPVEQAVLHDPERTSTPGQVVSDGTTCWLDESEQIHHPSIYIRNPDCGIDEKEFYHWDLCGHLVIRGLMDKQWLADANEAVDQNADSIHVGESTAARNSKRLAGTHGASLANPWELPEPYCHPFRRMIAHPPLLQRLNWIMGSGYECMSSTIFAHRTGGVGHFLHSGTANPLVGNHVRLQNGRSYAEHINVVWQLRDVTAADGGFCCIPGSHKGRYPLPESLATVDDDPQGAVQHVSMEAGDVLVFLAAAQTHGAFPWTGEQDRRAALFYYRGRNIRS